MRSLLRAGVAPALFSAWFAAFAATSERAVAQVGDHQYSTADIQTGSRLYGAQCALCHGQNGDGVAGVNLARQQFRRASSDDDIRNTITTGVAAGMRRSDAEASQRALPSSVRLDVNATPFTVCDGGAGRRLDGQGAARPVPGRWQGRAHCADLSDIGSIRHRPRFSGPFSNQPRLCHQPPRSSSRVTDALSAPKVRGHARCS